MATDLRYPRTSVNHSRTNRTLRSSIERKTNSVCLSMADILPCLCFGCVTRLYPAIVRLVTGEGELARKGFAEPARAVRHIEALSEHDEGDIALLVDEAARTLEPDLALATLVELVREDPSRVRALVEDRGFARRVLVVLGGSSELGRELVRRPQDLDGLAAAPVRRPASEISADLLVAVGGDPQEAVPVARAARATDELRYAYRRELIRIAARDAAAGDGDCSLQGRVGKVGQLAGDVVQECPLVVRGEVAGGDADQLSPVRVPQLVRRPCGPGHWHRLLGIAPHGHQQI